ncbi:MAG: tRNA (N6-threonylcarbamoyladenosine(37)-N6)-methyltransferase TrmO [Ruminococcaceae bacterium]|nr:tRNA (N6-threonylcarbamoyladenosine(37)-N6)-methyltransferase TrmO [Oscillospiraceae bacterium]
MKIIAKIRSDFKEKFGIPRQSGIADELTAKIVFEPEYRVSEALRGLDGYSHLWLIWQFSEAVREEWSPTVRPPRLGGNKRMGVFATRSPYRPNPIGLSSVKLIGIEHTKNEGDVLVVSGADLLDGTPIYDIKPYLPFTDSHPEAIAGFSEPVKDYALKVDFCKELLSKIDISKQNALIKILEHDPRPSYQDDPEREYGMKFSDYEIFFKVNGDRLTVTRVEVRK